jgi:pyridoxamine 5'-phosphate oxidase
MFKIKFAGHPVPRPPYWTGYRVVPQRIEFWKEGRFRCHERLEYNKTNGRWRVQRLFP